MMYDVIIVGAGVTGSAIARQLSRYDVNACVLEKNEDVCEGTSKANSAIVHAGFDAAEGSLMAKMNVRCNEMMDDLCRDLDIPFKRNGSMVVCIHKEELPGLKELYDRGIANGVKDMQLLNREEAMALEPNLSDKVEGALLAKTGGIICPFKLTIAMAENANVNGVDFRFNTAVEAITFVKREDAPAGVLAQLTAEDNGYFDDERVMHNKKRIIAPGEMEQVILQKKKLEERPDLKKITVKIEAE